jgi:hypothetical protein
MAKQTIKAFVHFQQEVWMDKPQFSIDCCDMSSHGYVLVGSQEFEVSIPDDFNPVAQQLASLEKRKTALRLKLAEELMAIDRRMNELQAIAHVPSDEVPAREEYADEGQPF